MLEELKLSGNNIESIRKKDFIKNVNLKILDIDGLMLGEIEDDAFEKLDELRFLNVSSNLLLYMPEFTKDMIKVDLSNNEFMCDCNMFPFYMFIRGVLRVRKEMKYTLFD